MDDYVKKSKEEQRDMKSYNCNCNFRNVRHAESVLSFLGERLKGFNKLWYGLTCGEQDRIVRDFEDYFEEIF